MKLPKFKFHPDSISADAIKASEEICECCNQATGLRKNT